MDKEKAKEAFEKWFGDSDTVYSNEFTNEFSAYLAGAAWAWGEADYQAKVDSVLAQIDIERNKLQAENKHLIEAEYYLIKKCFDVEGEKRELLRRNAKLRECVEFYADEHSWVWRDTDGAIELSDIESLVSIDDGEMYETGGKRARQCLKEIEQQSCDGAEHLEE